MQTKYRRYRLSDNNKINSFYKMPKFLFENEFKKLSNDSKLLYTLLRNTLCLSKINEWANSKEEIYIMHTRENMAEMLGCGLKKAQKAVNELKEYGLIEEERCGLCKPNKIYITCVDLENNWIGKKCSSREAYCNFQDGANIPTNNTNNIKTYNNNNIRPFSPNRENMSDYIILPDDDLFICLYKDYFRSYMGKEHMRVRQEDMDKIRANIEIIKECTSLDEFEDEVESHFENLPISNNGSIIVFLATMKRHFDKFPADFYF